MSGTLTSILLFHLASFMAVTAWWKLLRLRLFIRLVVDYAVMPSYPSKVAGTVIPIAELAIAVLLIAPGAYRYGLILLSVLLACIAWAVSRVVKEKRIISCGCYGPGLNAEADAYTLVKIGYLFLLVMLVLGTQAVPAGGGYGMALTAGLFLTSLLLAAQKVWTVYKKSAAELRKLE